MFKLLLNVVYIVISVPFFYVACSSSMGNKLLCHRWIQWNLAVVAWLELRGADLLLQTSGHELGGADLLLQTN